MCILLKYFHKCNCITGFNVNRGINVDFFILFMMVG